MVLSKENLSIARMVVDEILIQTEKDEPWAISAIEALKGAAECIGDAKPTCKSGADG